MTRRNRVRRLFILCNHFLRNLAFYRAGWRRGRVGQEPTLRRKENQFWMSVNGNFIDVCVLEWCKLFGDAKGKHHWGKVISKKAEFEQQLLARLRMTPEQFQAYIEEMRRYRDKFVAHLDDEPIMYLPRLRPAKGSVAFLYHYLLENEDDGAYFPENPVPARCMYVLWLNTGRHVYAT